MRIVGIIPARFSSSRFPGKPLADIAGKSMIQRVYEQAMKSNLAEVIVATDDERILEHVRNFGGKGVMTASSHRNGTERCQEVAKTLENCDVVINIQGDEPLIDPHEISTVANCFNDSTVQIATLSTPINSAQELFSPNVPKVVTNTQGFALYFSRLPIPYFRDAERDEWLTRHEYKRHIGIYGFRKEVLESVVKLTPTPLELAESLEQLRWLENGYTIKVEQVIAESLAVDTPQDLEYVTRIVNERML